MAIVMAETRKQVGVRPDGSPRVEVTRHGHARRPESLAEWREQRVAALGPGPRTLPAGRIVVALLEADGDAAVKAAVDAGRDLDAYGRWAVLQTLEAWRTAAQDGYPPAMGLITRLRTAWVRRWGSAEPRRVA